MKRKIGGEVTAIDALQLPLPPPVGGGEAAGDKAAHGGDDEATVAEEQRLEEGGEEGGEDREEEEEEEEEEGEEKGEKGYDKFDHLEIDDDGEADDTERPKLAEDFYEIEAVRKKRVRKGEAQYLIKWRGWPEMANTWEPIENLLFCSDVIDAFEERRSSGCAFPVVIVAHPSQPNQIVLGMSDGAVYVIEPFDAEQNWGRIVPL